MATYPVELPQLEGTEVRPDSGVKVRVAKSGKRRLRYQYSEDRYDVIIRHYLTQAEAATLDAFYTANAKIPFSFVYQADSVTYSCLFVGRPLKVPKIGGHYEVTTRAFVV